ncbi:MAG: hypothetical protein R3F56_19180 [Planctomycetota bacterium]
MIRLTALLSIAPALAASLAAQAVIQPRPQIDLTAGKLYQRGTDISSAPRFRGIAASPVALPPRSAGEVWTSKLVYHAWAMETTTSSGDYDVYFTRTLDGGISFETPRRLDAQAGSAEEVSVAANGHTVCVSWLSNETTGDDHVYALVSLDQGLNFQGPFLLNDPTLVPLGDTDEHWLAAGNDAYYFVWEYDDRGRAATTGDEDVRFNRIDIVGSTIQVGLDVRLNQPGSSNIDDVDSPIVISDPTTNDVAVFWFDDRGGVAGANGLYGVWSRNAGIDFPLAQDTLLAGPPAADVRNRNNVVGVIANGFAHLVWEDRRNQANGGFDEPFYERVDLASNTLLYASTSGLRLSDWTPPGAHEMDLPQIAVNTANPAEVIACWHDDRDLGGGSNNSYNDIFYTVSRDRGVNWTANQRVSTTSGPGTGERNECWGVSWHGDHVVVVGERSAGNVPNSTAEDVVYYMSQDGARTWSPEFVTMRGSAFTPPGNDIDDPFHVVTVGRNDIVVSFKDDSYGASNDLATSGLRVPYVRLTAPFQTGNQVQIEVAQIAESNRNGITLLVYHSATSPVAPGFYPFGGGIDVDLTFDAFTLALLGIQPLSVLTNPTGGRASTPILRVPPGYRAPSFRVQAVVFDATLQVRETSDAFQF